MRKLAVALVLISLSRSQADGGVVYNDGGTHNVSSASADILVTNATTLNVQSGAQITSVNGTFATPPTHAVDAEGAGTAVNVSGGSLVGGNNVAFSGYAASSALRVGPGAAALLTGGTFQGGIDATSQNSAFAVDAISAASVTVQGGLFHAVSGVNPGGSFAFFGDIPSTPSTLSITGGTFDGQVSVVLFGSGSSASIAGGTFLNSRLFLDGHDSSSMTISGGQFAVPALVLSLTNGATLSFAGTGLQFIGNGQFGGRLSGTLADGNPFNELITIVGLYPLNVSVSSNRIVFAAPTPAPASLIMLSLGMAPVSLVAWRRRCKA